MQDLTKDVFRIDAIPSQSLDTVREWLSSMDIKFYENKVNLNWKQVLKSIVDVRPPTFYLYFHCANLYCKSMTCCCKASSAAVHVLYADWASAQS